MARRRGWETATDMVRSLSLVLLPVLLVAGFVVLTGPDRVQTPTVDTAPVLERARAEADFPAAVPSSLPEGWRATSAEVVPDGNGLRWEVGLLTEQERYVGIVQAGGRTGERLVEDRLEGWQEVGRYPLGARTWTRLEAPDDGRRALLAQDGEVITIVSTRGPWSLAEELARTLPPPS